MPRTPVPPAFTPSRHTGPPASRWSSIWAVGAVTAVAILADLPRFGLAAAAAAIVLVDVWSRDAPPLAAGQHEALWRRLAWYRRRREPCDLLIARVAGAEPERQLARLRAAFRATDAVECVGPRGRGEVRAILDLTELSRAGLARRLQAEGIDVRCRWARFPDDALTLEALIDHAQQQREQPAVSAAPSPPSGAIPVLNQEEAS